MFTRHIRVRGFPKWLAQQGIDFVAAYIIPLDLWYILPAPVTTRLHGHISLSPHRKGHKYEPYLEAWHLRAEIKPFFATARIVTRRKLLEELGVRTVRNCSFPFWPVGILTITFGNSFFRAT